MKKLLLSIGLMQAISATAQVTLTTNELPYAGMSFAISEDSVMNISPGNSGTGQVWDFTNLQVQPTDTILFEDASLSPYTGFFPGSNLVAHYKKDSVYGYYTTNQDGMFLDGSYETASSVNAAFHYSPSVTVIPVPFSMGDTHLSHAVAEFNSTGSGTAFKLIHHQIDTLSGDATGVLKVPGAVYSSTLRINVRATGIDSIFVDANGNGNFMFFSVTVSRNVTYRWFKQGAPSYVLGIEVNFSNPSITERIELNTPAGNPATVDEKGNSFAPEIFPNPASDVIYVKGNIPESASLEIFSPTGQKVMSGTIGGSKEVNISRSGLNGLYYYKINSGGMVIKSGKIIINNN